MINFVIETFYIKHKKYTTDFLSIYPIKYYSDKTTKNKLIFVKNESRRNLRGYTVAQDTRDSRKNVY